MIQYKLAPLAGYTDLPYRRVCRRYGLRYAHTALVDSGALTHGNKENQYILARGEDEDFLAVQLLGSRLDFLEIAAKKLLEMDFDAVDFNMGCPVSKVFKREAGAALMRNLPHAVECVKLLRDIFHGKRFTVKTRILDPVDPEPTLELCRALQDCGIDALTIHGRTARQIYSGPVAANIIRAVRQSLSIPVTANGGIFTKADADRLAADTGCESLMVARGSIGNPWIFRELITGDSTPPVHEERIAIMREHVNGMLDFYGEAAGAVISRKVILSYLCGHGYLRSLRSQATYIADRAQFDAFCREIEANPPHLT